MNIAILGTRGIPNHYGGFEQFAEFFSVYLAGKGHDVYVYNSHNHPYQEQTFNGVHIIHCFDPEYKIGSAGQFVYDYNCIKDSRSRNFDIILQLGYTSSSVWHWLMPKEPLVITNMDGLEWKRSKYAPPMRRFLKYAESLAAKHSDYLIADSVGIQQWLKERYGKESEYIAYGATVFNNPDEAILKEFGLEPQGYNMLMARFEPENNLEMVLEGVAKANDETPILVIGNYHTKYGKYLTGKFSAHTKIRFIGPLYNLGHLNNLRYFSKIYFHGHSVGGTNPSLLEAMASNTLIAAHNNIFNKSVLKDNAYYFSNPDGVRELTERLDKREEAVKTGNNIKAVQDYFNWETINGKYLHFFEACLAKADRAHAG